MPGTTQYKSKFQGQANQNSPPPNSTAVFEWEAFQPISDFSDDSMMMVYQRISRDIIERPYHYDKHKLFDKNGKQIDYRHEKANNHSAPQKIPGGVVYKQNHGSGHSLRQMMYTDYLIDSISKKGNPNGQRIAKAVNGDPQIKSAIKLAAYCKRIGRTLDHERSNEKPTIYSKRSADMFANIAKELGFDDALIDIINQSMLEPSPRKTNGTSYKGIPADELCQFSENILMASHMADLVRIKNVKQKYIRTRIAKYFEPNELASVTRSLVEFACRANEYCGNKISQQDRNINHNVVRHIDGKKLVNIRQNLNGAVSEFARISSNYIRKSGNLRLLNEHKGVAIGNMQRFNFTNEKVAQQALAEIKGLYPELPMIDKAHVARDQNNQFMFRLTIRQWEYIQKEHKRAVISSVYQHKGQPGSHMQRFNYANKEEAQQVLADIKKLFPDLPNIENARVKEDNNNRWEFGLTSSQWHVIEREYKNYDVNPTSVDDSLTKDTVDEVEQSKEQQWNANARVTSPINQRSADIRQYGTSLHKCIEINSDMIKNGAFDISSIDLDFNQPLRYLIVKDPHYPEGKFFIQAQDSRIELSPNQDIIAKGDIKIEPTSGQIEYFSGIENQTGVLEHLFNAMGKLQAMGVNLDKCNVRTIHNPEVVGFKEAKPVGNKQYEANANHLITHLTKQMKTELDQVAKGLIENKTEYNRNVIKALPKLSWSFIKSFFGASKKQTTLHNESTNTFKQDIIRAQKQIAEAQSPSDLKRAAQLIQRALDNHHNDTNQLASKKDLFQQFKNRHRQHIDFEQHKEDKTRTVSMRQQA